MLQNRITVLALSFLLVLILLHIGRKWRGAERYPRTPRKRAVTWILNFPGWTRMGTRSVAKTMMTLASILRIYQCCCLFTLIQITGEAAGGCRVGSCSQGDEGGWAHCSCWCLIEILFNIWLKLIRFKLSWRRQSKIWFWQNTSGGIFLGRIFLGRISYSKFLRLMFFENIWWVS